MTGPGPACPGPARTHWAVLRDAPFAAPWHDGARNLNLLAIRSSAPDVSDRFDDAVVVSYQVRAPTGLGLAWVTRAWRCTTDAGRYYRENPLDPRGCAVIAPGHYHLSYEVGCHKGRPALVQRAPLQAWRVRAGRRLDTTKPTVDAPAACGLNIHDGGNPDGPVGRWSAGCIVVPLGLGALLDLVARQRAAGLGPRVSLTLVSTRDLPIASTLLAYAVGRAEPTVLGLSVGGGE